MKTKLVIVAAFLAAFTPLMRAESASSSVKVQFQDPEKFTDVRTSSMATDSDREGLLSQFEEFIVSKIQARLPEGQKVDVVVKDIDMAGDFEPWRFEARDVRIVKDVYPPRVKLSFKVTDSSGKVIKEGDRSLSDLGFMNRLVFDRNDMLRYEKSLISDWVSDDFPKAKKS